MQQYRDTDYAAVSAALHAREAKLLTQAMAERMIDAAAPEESYKTLLECGYAPLERCTLENVEHALSQARRELYREVSVLAPDKRIIELFQVKYDYHNAKLALKSKRTGEDVSRLAMDCGRFDAQKVLRGETSAVSAAMSRAMAQAESEAGHSGDVRMAELLLDRACYEEMSALAGETGSTFLKDYVALQIDAVNLRTLVRARRMGCEDDVLAAAMLPGGHIPAGQLKGARGDHLSSLTHGTPLDSAGELAAKLLDSGGGLTEFERACDDALMSYLQRARQRFGLPRPRARHLHRGKRRAGESRPPPHGEGELRHHLYHRTPRRADPRGDRAPARGCFARRHPHPGQGGEPRHRHSGRARGCGKGRRRGHFVKKEQKPYGKDR